MGVTEKAGLRGTSLIVRIGLKFRWGFSCGEEWRRIHSPVLVNSLTRQSDSRNVLESLMPMSYSTVLSLDLSGVGFTTNLFIPVGVWTRRS